MFFNIFNQVIPSSKHTLDGITLDGITWCLPTIEVTIQKCTVADSWSRDIHINVINIFQLLLNRFLKTSINFPPSCAQVDPFEVEGSQGSVKRRWRTSTPHFLHHSFQSRFTHGYFSGQILLNFFAFSNIFKSTKSRQKALKIQLSYLVLFLF